MKKLTLLALFLSVLTSLQAQESELSEGILFDGEPYLAMDPQNPQHMVVAWMGYAWLNRIAIHYRVTFDGGNTWSPPAFIPHQVDGYTCADPSLAFDSEGRVFVCYIDYIEDGSAGAVYVRRSDDGGLTWNDAVEVISVEEDPGEYPLDRPWMAIDRSGGPNDGNIYINTKPAPWEPIPNASYFIRSTDGGASFEDWVYTDAPGWSVGDFIASPMAVPTVGSDGLLHIAYPGWDPAESLIPRIMLASSDDGGNAFSYNTILEVTGGGVDDTLPKLGYSIYSDPTNPDHIIIVYMADYLADVDIYLLETPNGGATWNEPVRVNADTPGNGIMQDLGWGAFNQTGDFLFSWRDRRNAGMEGYQLPAEIKGRVWHAGDTWSDEFNFSETAAPHNEILNGNGNDFMGCALSEDTAFAVWGDARDGILRIWFAKKSMADSSVWLLDLNQMPPLEVYPNPANDLIQVKTNIPSKAAVFDIHGSLLFTTIVGNNQPLVISQLPPGRYQIRTSSGQTATFIKE